MIQVVSQRSHIILGLYVLAAALPAAAQAPARPQTPAAPPAASVTVQLNVPPGAIDAPVLTLDQALHQAKQANRDLKQAGARVAQSHAGVEQALSVLLPTVAVQGKYTRNYKQVSLNLSGLAPPSGVVRKLGSFLPGDQEIQNYANMLEAVEKQGSIIIQRADQLDFSATLTVPLVVPSAYPGYAASRRTEDAARANFDVSDATVLFSAAQGYYACAGTDELVQARRNAVGVAQKALDNAKARLEAGVVNRVEVTRADLQLTRAQQALIEAQDNQATVYRSLATLLNYHQPFKVQAETPGDRAVNVDELAQSSLHLRPEFRVLEKTVAANRESVRSNAWRWAPTLSGFFNVRAFNYPGFSGDNYSWAGGVQLDWLIYDGGVRDSARHLALAQRQENEARLELLRDTVRDDVYNAERAVHVKHSALEAATRSVQLSRETLDLVQVQHDAGTATQLDLLQAQDNLVAAEVALAQARFDLALSSLSLERNAGVFPNNRGL